MKPTITKEASPTVPTVGQMGDREDHRKTCRRPGPGGISEEASRAATAQTRTSHVCSLKVAARDYIWLYDVRHGVHPHEIASREGVSVRQVREGLERARSLECHRSQDDPSESLKAGRIDSAGFRLMPLFPIGAFTPQSTCPHRGDIERGSRLCCMVCHSSGMDDHPGLGRDPKTDPSPEPSPAAPAADTGLSKAVDAGETRKQRRRRQFTPVAVA